MIPCLQKYPFNVANFPQWKCLDSLPLTVRQRHYISKRTLQATGLSWSFDLSLVYNRELSLSAKYEMTSKFKDYSPFIFRHIRENIFRLDPTDIFPNSALQADLACSFISAETRMPTPTSLKRCLGYGSIHPSWNVYLVRDCVVNKCFNPLQHCQPTISTIPLMVLRGLQFGDQIKGMWNHLASHSSWFTRFSFNSSSCRFGRC